MVQASKTSLVLSAIAIHDVSGRDHNSEWRYAQLGCHDDKRAVFFKRRFQPPLYSEGRIYNLSFEDDLLKRF